VVELEITQTRAGQTTFYGAPELRRGAVPSEASDVWVWVLTVFEVLAGEPAFDPRMGLLPLPLQMVSDHGPRVRRGCYRC
jgi:hypothetical protein